MNEILGSKILIVDDMPDNALLLGRILTRQGYKVRKALNGLMALDLLGSESADLLLVDVNMPGMDGYELCGIIKSESATKEIPVIFISAQDDLQNVVQAFSLGAVDYITKPFRSEEVLARVNTHLSLHYLRRQLQTENLALQQEICQQLNVDPSFYEDLSNAIHNQELELFYQPIVALLDNIKVDGFEALLRWQHPQKGTISPLEFIPIAESTGLIHVIGEWVIDEAVQQLALWHKRFPGIIMSINVSAKQLLNATLVSTVARAIRKTGVDPATIKLEITESAIICDVEQAIAQLHKLRGLGVQICLDDFGVGYSSLSRVQDFPVNIIKIDRSFISQGNWTIINVITILAALLDMQVIAEGIENFEQLKNVRDLTCHYAQGYLFARPLSVAQADDLLESKIPFNLV